MVKLYHKDPLAYFITSYFFFIGDRLIYCPLHCTFVIVTEKAHFLKMCQSSYFLNHLFIKKTVQLDSIYKKEQRIRSETGEQKHYLI